MTSKHSIRYGVDSTGLWVTIGCPYDESDDTRPCAIVDRDGDGFDAEMCGLQRWLEDIGQEQFVGLYAGASGLAVEHAIDFRWTDDGVRWTFDDTTPNLTPVTIEGREGTSWEILRDPDTVHEERIHYGTLLASLPNIEIVQVETGLSIAIRVKHLPNTELDVRVETDGSPVFVREHDAVAESNRPTESRSHTAKTLGFVMLPISVEIMSRLASVFERGTMVRNVSGLFPVDSYGDAGLREYHDAYVFEIDDDA